MIVRNALTTSREYISTAGMREKAPSGRVALRGSDSAYRLPGAFLMSQHRYSGMLIQ
ncbi:hypothetical protein HL670_02957 [Serratia plymuthica]|nr:hypothetical protein HL670_02957 [Serratia plymuthica]CAI0818254.1 Uncharacterised protein [Serratia plymuthica]